MGAHGGDIYDGSLPPHTCIVLMCPSSLPPSYPCRLWEAWGTMA